MWIPMDSEDIRAYWSGDMIPLHVRKRADGMDVWQPHTFSDRGSARICQRCRLHPIDYDAVEIDCEEI